MLRYELMAILFIALRLKIDEEFIGKLATNIALFLKNKETFRFP